MNNLCFRGVEELFLFYNIVCFNRGIIATKCVAFCELCALQLNEKQICGKKFTHFAYDGGLHLEQGCFQ